MRMQGRSTVRASRATSRRPAGVSGRVPPGSRGNGMLRPYGGCGKPRGMPWTCLRLPPRRRSPLRLRGFDYAQPGAYFVTVCTHGRETVFGVVVDGEMRLSAEGQIVVECWKAVSLHFACVALDVFVVMPNHVHGLLWLAASPNDERFPVPVGATHRSCREARRHTGARRHASPLRRVGRHPGPAESSLGAIVGSFKSAATRGINDLPGRRGAPVWQRGFHEHVIRDEEDLDRVRRYIEANPIRWAADEENPERRIP